MRKLPVIVAVLGAVFAVAARIPAEAQSATPQQIQALIAQGQEQAALAELQPVLQAHPDSGVGWYLTAEAQDAAGNETAARAALANAEHDAPGLPFARPDEVVALQAHLAGVPAAGGAAYSAPGQSRSGGSPALVGIIGLVILFLVLRMLFRRRRFVGQPGFPGGYGTAGYGPVGPAPGPYPYGPGPGGMGSGLGGSLLGGLAAGAGFAAGERVIDDMLGRNNDPMGGNFQQDQNFGNGVPDRDDGLQGNPGWDDGSNQDGNFDPGNNW